MAYSQWSVDTAATLIATTCDKPGPVLITLQALQEKFGFVHTDAIALIAKACNVSRADVHGVLTYYHDLRSAPPARDTIRICVAEACQAVGSRQLVGEVEKAFGAQIGQVNGDLEIHPDYCLGNCALGPTAKVNGELMGYASVSKMMSLLESQNGRRD